MQIITNEGIERFLSLVIPLGYKIRFYGGEFYLLTYTTDIIPSLNIKESSLQNYLISEELVTEYEIGDNYIIFRATDLTPVNDGYKYISLVGLVDSSNNLISVSRVNDVKVRNSITSFEYKFTIFKPAQISNIKILGKRTVCNDETGSFIISNYDPLSVYEISCINGGVGWVDSSTLYFIRDNNYNDATIVIKRNNIPKHIYLTIEQPRNETPSIIYDSVCPYIGYDNIIRATDYTTNCHSRFHQTSDQVFTKDSTEYSSYDDPENLNSILQPFGMSSGDLTVKVRYKNNKNEYTNQSDPVDLTLTNLRKIDYLAKDPNNDVSFYNKFGYKNYQILKVYATAILYNNGIIEHTFTQREGSSSSGDVLLTNNGNRAIIRYKDNFVCVYDKNINGEWEYYTINAPNSSEYSFGIRMGISGNGEQLLINDYSYPSYSRGTIHVYKLVDGTYALNQNIVGQSNYERLSLGSLTNFNVSDDGLVAVAKRDKINERLVVLRRNGNTWNIHQTMGNVYTDIIGVSNCGNFVWFENQIYVQNGSNFVLDYSFTNQKIYAVNNQYCITLNSSNNRIIYIYKRENSSQQIVETLTLQADPALIYFSDPNDSSKIGLVLEYSLDYKPVYSFYNLVI